MVLPKRVFRSSFRVFAEIVCGELGGLAEEGSELLNQHLFEKRYIMGNFGSCMRMEIWREVHAPGERTSDRAWKAVSPDVKVIDMLGLGVESG